MLGGCPAALLPSLWRRRSAPEFAISVRRSTSLKRSWPTRADSVLKAILSGIEKGLVLPTLSTLTLLAERLEVDPMDLLTFPATSERHALVDATRKLGRGTIRKLLRDLRAV